MCLRSQPSFGSSLDDQVFQDFVRLGSHYAALSRDEFWDARQSNLSTLRPIPVNGFAERAGLQHVLSFSNRQVAEFSDIQQHIVLCQIPTVDKVGLISSKNECMAAVERLSPLGQFLSEATVVSHRSLSVRQALSCHSIGHVGLRLLDVDVAAGEQFFQRYTFRWRLGMQWEEAVPDMNVELASQSVSTPGTEVAPRSDEVGINLERYGIHCLTNLSEQTAWLGYMRGRENPQ